MSGTKYAMLGSGILLWFTTACSVSSPVKKLSVPLPCYNEIQLTKEGWEEDRLSGYYRIDRTKLPNVEMIGMCFKNLDPDAFQSVFGAASTREKYKGSSKLWYNVFGEDTHTSKVEVLYIRDSLIQINYHDCNNAIGELKNGFRYDRDKGHYTISESLPHHVQQRLSYCLSGADSNEIKTLIGEPEQVEKNGRKWLYFTENAAQDVNMTVIPRLEVLFDEDGKMTSFYHLMGVEMVE